MPCKFLGGHSLASLAEDAEKGHETVARNAFHLVLGQATTTVLGILFSAVLGRSLGASDFGVYFLIASFSAFAYVLVDWGQQFLIVREVARLPERGGQLLGTALVLRTAGAALVAVPFGLVAWALGYDAATCWYSVIFIAVSLPFFLRRATDWFSALAISWALMPGCRWRTSSRCLDLPWRHWPSVQGFQACWQRRLSLAYSHLLSPPSSIVG